MITPQPLFREPVDSKQPHPVYAMVSADRKAVIVGISGCSSSGKTTLARLLRDIFPNTFILHEDDFYKQDDQ